MKKRFNLLIIALTVVTIAFTIFVIMQKRRSHLLLHRIPTSKSHLHMSPEGDVVAHVHTYKTPDLAETDEAAKTYVATGTDIPKSKKKTNTQIAWEKLDIDALKKAFQPYTVAEMHSRWKYREMILPDGPSYERNAAKWDSFRDPDEWLQRFMDLGYPFHVSGNYRMALQDRTILKRKLEWANDPEYGRAKVLSGMGLPLDATWEEHEETFIKFKVVAAHALERALQADPHLAGGAVTTQGVFTHFKEDTLSAYISEEAEYSTFTGLNLTREEKENLRMYGIAPKGIHVVYTDKNGNPLPAEAPIPRFYERRMKQLEEAERQVEKMIADHEALFKSLPEQTQQVVPVLSTPSPQQDEHAHPHPHDLPNTQENAQRPKGSEPKRQFPPEMLPPEPPGPHNIQQWFEILQDLHGGDLPKDLKTLREVIKELESIRIQGEEKLPQPPERPTPPETPSEQ